MGAKSPISLLNFIIFNPTLGQKEGEEHKKILYYHPKETDLDTQIRTVGLCEAFVKFTITFDPVKPCQAVHTKKTCQLYLEAESNFWMILTVNIPFTQKTKDDQVTVDYQSEDVQDNVYQAILKQTYQMFRFFMGPFELNMKTCASITHLKENLEHFFSRYLHTLRLQDSDIMDIFSGISFLPLDKNNFLKIQFFINRLESSFTLVKYMAFLFNDQLVWSGLEQEDMQIMYKYLTTNLFPACVESELQIGAASSTVFHTNSVSPHFGKFILGPPNLNESDLGKIPRIFINVETKCEECYLVAYRALGATVCLLVDITANLNIDFFKKLDGFLGSQLSSLASEIGDQYNKKPTSNASSDVNFKYIYFNHMNLAQKSAVHGDAKRTGSINIPSDVMKVISDLNFDLKRLSKGGELILKTMSDCWIVGKYSDQREFYVVIHQKNANLIEINDFTKMSYEFRDRLQSVDLASVSLTNQKSKRLNENTSLLITDALPHGLLRLKKNDSPTSSQCNPENIHLWKDITVLAIAIALYNIVYYGLLFTSLALNPFHLVLATHTANFSSQIICALFLSHYLYRSLRCKIAITISLATAIVYAASQFYPNHSTFIPAGIVIGAGCVTLRITSLQYGNLLSRYYVASSVEISPWITYVIFGCVNYVPLFGGIIGTLLPAVILKSNDQIEWGSMKSSGEVTYNVCFSLHSLGCVLGFAWTIVLCIVVKLYIYMGFLLLAILLHVIAIILQYRPSRLQQMM
uniref:CCZ1/INTU/HSP4 first Longin domain-containing protein n=1 Tax=Strigamia maritima TaxID=126957 RepID=T1JG93_STRMM